MKRLFDFVLALFVVAASFLLILLVALSVFFTSTGPALYWSGRVGRKIVIFNMPKFRTMRIDTPAKATHLMNNPNRYLTPLGGFF